MAPTVQTGSIRESSDRICRFRTIAGRGFRAAVEVTRRCNIACLHCFVPNERKDPELEALVKLIRQLADSGCRKLILTGGEPLLRADLEEIIREATTVGIGVDLNSNLVKLSEERMDALVAAGLAEASASFYGDAPFHDRFVRCPGAFDRTSTSCRNLRNRGVAIDIHGPVWAENFADAGFVYQHAESLSAESVTFFKVVGLRGGSGGSLFGPTRFGALSEEFRAPPLDELARILQSLRQEGSIPLRTVGFWGDLKSECEQASSIVGVTADLTLSPCLLSRNPHRDNSPAGDVELELTRMRSEVAFGHWRPICTGCGADVKA